MNSVAPSCLLNSFSPSVNDSDSTSSWLAPRWVWTAGRGRSVGSSKGESSASRSFQ
jgi:hypothetical protein